MGLPALVPPRGRGRRGEQTGWPGWGDAVLGAGLLAVWAYNARRWRADRALAASQRAALHAPAPPLPAAPLVSVLVAAWNEGPGIARHIESVLGLAYPHREYILCAGGTDGTLETARRYVRDGVLVLVQAPGEGKQRALRRAFERSSGSIVYLTDADCVIDDVSLERVLAPLIQDGEAAATGGSIPPPAQRQSSPFAAYQWAVQQYGLARAPAYGEGLLGRNAAVRRDALEACGAFSAPAPTGTDYHLAKALRRQGYRIRTVPHSLVVTPYASGWAGYARQQRRWLRNVVVLGAQSGARPEVRASLQTSLLGLTMLLGGATLFSGPGATLPFALWCLGLAQSMGAKLRYLNFGRLLDGQGPAPLLRSLLLTLSYSLGEFAVWALPLLDLPFAARRRRW
ncbi:MAG TPA: glycosyltransferase family 2 protein [Chloroflexota bacterium]|nr:glycosyltransferase family 2 protein [Chloroflexota bacterium]